MPTKKKKTPAKPKIAIACQGGGSQTAFTAGALKALLEGGVLDHYEIVSLSGTSGGAICASLVWYALQKEDPYPAERLMTFWRANMAGNRAEQMFNGYLVDNSRKITRGHMPTISMAPDAPLLQLLKTLSTVGLRKEFTDFELLISQHFDFDELERWGARATGPVLALGAVNVLNGKLAVYNSRKNPIRNEYIRASCAVPTIFPAVEFDGGAYWDGLFSDNPPLTELVQAAFVGVDHIPDELWVIKINPTGTRLVPRSPDEIADRRNELIGNMSLFQQLDTLAWMNELLLRGAFKDEYLEKLDVRAPLKMPMSSFSEERRDYHIPFIEMSEHLQQTLDYETKLDRSPDNLRRLIADGEQQASAFLAERLAAR